MSQKFPSVDTLMTRLDITKEKALVVFSLMKETVKPNTIPETQAWIDRCYHLPSPPELVMHAIDITIGGYGVEHFGPLEGRRFTPRWSYSNTGDIYNATVVFNNRENSFAVTSPGDIIDMGI